VLTEGRSRGSLAALASASAKATADGRSAYGAKAGARGCCTLRAVTVTVPVQLEHVSFAYAGRPPVLKDVSLGLQPGEICAFVGRSGVGKTTLLKLVNRLLLPTAGRVMVEGRETREWDPIRLRRRVGYVFQDVGLFPHMTIEENIGIVPKL
jgi:osmoprotectant transport system ATP-binding protein